MVPGDPTPARCGVVVSHTHSQHPDKVFTSEMHGPMGNESHEPTQRGQKVRKRRRDRDGNGERVALLMHMAMDDSATRRHLDGRSGFPRACAQSRTGPSAGSSSRDG